MGRKKGTNRFLVFDSKAQTQYPAEHIRETNCNSNQCIDTQQTTSDQLIRDQAPHPRRRPAVFVSCTSLAGEHFTQQNLLLQVGKVKSGICMPVCKNRWVLSCSTHTTSTTDINIAVEYSGYDKYCSFPPHVTGRYLNQVRTYYRTIFCMGSVQQMNIIKERLFRLDFLL